jgi:hypothetical protein
MIERSWTSVLTEESYMARSSTARKKAVEPIVSGTSTFLGATCVVPQIIEGVAIGIIKDLQMLCELYKKEGEEELKEIVPRELTIDMSQSWPEDPVEKKNPRYGTYVGIGLGEHGMNLGFLMIPVVEFLKKHFEKIGKSPVELSGDRDSYMTMGGMVNPSETVFITPKGVFSISRTHTYFIARKVS